MKETLYFGMFSALLALIPASAEVDCLKLSVLVKSEVTSEQANVLEIVSKRVAAAPGCSCEVVKAAIEASEAEPKTVAAIVEAAATAAPEQMRLISQCAVAVAPDAITEVQAVLAKLDPNRGEAVVASAKSAKDAKAPVEEVASIPNPLDFPGEGPVGPLPGEYPGGTSVVPITPPAVINPPVVTETDPQSPVDEKPAVLTEG